MEEKGADWFKIKAKAEILPEAYHGYVEDKISAFNAEIGPICAFFRSGR